MDGVILTPLKQIYHPKGDIFHAMKKSDIGFDGFGEAYFSTINQNDIKGWKKHTKMTLNIVVPVGNIEFVVYDEKTKEFFSTKLSHNNYQRLTLKAGLWMAFKGLDKYNMLLNLASIEHDPNEAINIGIEEIKYEW
ncbi:WxcM-like domain-containing protein [Aliarcobacter butzleri]|uniref:WxcM-like domain-containing protein n=1 Tax=Aliarcobacter butzleri TaxID=28197 RepID=UPI00125FA1BE|nr:WxcM-like domain-containing protein [Aliarcobacter butzleri]MCT7626119.1 WxcM-like domain-containing protein [Aliarcobacter butzleri]MCT7644162.1 WxcM-like domain-containing protein [Aliarcobacter butzleri]